MLEAPPFPDDPQERCANCGALTTGVAQCLTCHKFICLVCYTTDNCHGELRSQFFCQTCTEAMSDAEDVEDPTQVVSDNEENQEEDPVVSDTNEQYEDQDEEEYAPTDEDEANSSEEEGVSRGGGKKKENEVRSNKVGSNEEHEFDDAIGTIYYV